MRLGRLTYKNITRTQPVQERIRMVREIQDQRPGISSTLSLNLLAGREIRSQIPAAALDREGVYFCFGGDVSSFISATGKRSFVAYDQFPLINEGWLDQQTWMFMADFPEAVLEGAARGKQGSSYFHNTAIFPFKEVGIFAIFDILGFGGTDLQVFEAVEKQGVYKLTFNLMEGNCQVVCVQDEIEPGRMPLFISEIEIGCMFIKAGKTGVTR